jgi:hypothetical protein
MNLAENAGKRGPYKPIEKARVKQEIYSKILEGHSYADIMRFMHMPERTFYRYLDAIKAEESSAILQGTLDKKELAWQIQLCRDGLREDMQRMLVIAADPTNRLAVAAQHLAGEIRCTILKSYVEGPITMIQTKGFPNYLPLNDEENRTKLRLLPIKDPDTQMVTGYRLVKEKEEDKEYDELDYGAETEAEGLEEDQEDGISKDRT